MGNVNMYLIEFVYSISPSIRAVKKDVAIILFMRKKTRFYSLVGVRYCNRC